MTDGRQVFLQEHEVLLLLGASVQSLSVCLLYTSLFLEPMGLDTEEVYVQGFSSSMPFDVQREMLRSVKGLERCV